MSWWAGGLIVSLALLVGCATEPAVKKQKHLDRGTAYLKQRKYNEAILELRNAIQINSATAANANVSAARLSRLSHVSQMLCRPSSGWSSSASLSISFNPVKVRMPQRATLSFQLSNPLGAADLLLHGSNGLRGWGQPSFPDQSLLYVRGFDPGTVHH